MHSIPILDADVVFFPIADPFVEGGGEVAALSELVECGQRQL
jgi:hypothetical protein